MKFSQKQFPKLIFPKIEGKAQMIMPGGLGPEG